MLYTIVNFTTQCGENRHTDISNFATLIHCVVIFTILYGNYYPPRAEFKLICIGKFARRTWVNFIQQYGKNRQRCQQNTFYYAVWQLLLYFYREFPSKILSVYEIFECKFKYIIHKDTSETDDGQKVKDETISKWVIWKSIKCGDSGIDVLWL